MLELVDDNELFGMADMACCRCRADRFWLCVSIVSIGEHGRDSTLLCISCVEKMSLTTRWLSCSAAFSTLVFPCVPLLLMVVALCWLRECASCETRRR